MAETRKVKGKKSFIGCFQEAYGWKESCERLRDKSDRPGRLFRPLHAVIVFGDLNCLSWKTLLHDSVQVLQNTDANMELEVQEIYWGWCWLNIKGEGETEGLDSKSLRLWLSSEKISSSPTGVSLQRLLIEKSQEGQKWHFASSLTTITFFSFPADSEKIQVGRCLRDNLGSIVQKDFLQWWRSSISSLANMVATNHMYLATTWNVTSVTKELDFSFN